MPARPIPTTGETLPLVGLGSTRPVTAIAERGPEPVAAVIRTLVEHGGRVVDTWPRSDANDGAFGEIISAPSLSERLFVTINLEQQGREAGRAHFERTLRLYRRERIDLLNVGSLIDLDAQWPNLRAAKDSGRARYIGVTAAQAALYEQLETFLARERPDFVEINYSVTEREAERLLPTAGRPRHRRADQPAVHERHVLRAARERAAAGLGSRVRVHELGGILAAVHPREPGRHLRSHGDDERRAHGRERARRVRAGTEQARAPAHARHRRDAVRSAR